MAISTLVSMGFVVTGMATSASAAKKPPVPTVHSVSPDTGPTSGGTVVTIRGKDIVGATAVDFGGTAALTFTPKGNNSITATAPPNGTAGPVDVTVTVGADTSATGPADIYSYVGVGPTIQSVSPRVGADTGGTKVTIAGSDFSTATEVEFGTISVPFTIDSNQAISTVSPAEAPGKVDVTVTGPDGTSPTEAADMFTFAVRVPIVSSIEPQSGPVGTMVTITGSRFAKKGTTVTFGGTPATNVTVVSSTSITADAPASAGTVDITVSDSKGTSSSSPVDQFTYTT